MHRRLTPLGSPRNKDTQDALSIASGHTLPGRMPKRLWPLRAARSSARRCAGRWHRRAGISGARPLGVAGRIAGRRSVLGQPDSAHAGALISDASQKRLSLQRFFEASLIERRALLRYTMMRAFCLFLFVMAALVSCR